MKKCTKCGEEKELTEFSKKKSQDDGLQRHCKKCCAVYAAKHRAKPGNKLKAKKYNEEYREKNADELEKKRVKYYAKNAEAKKEYRKRYYLENKDRELARQAQWVRDNREKINGLGSAYRARKFGADGASTCDQIKSRFDYYGNKCIYCGSTDSLQIEHRIPLYRGGTNWPANLAPACKSCNCKKGTKTEKEYKAEIEKK